MMEGRGEGRRGVREEGSKPAKEGVKKAKEGCEGVKEGSDGKNAKM